MLFSHELNELNAMLDKGIDVSVFNQLLVGITVFLEQALQGCYQLVLAQLSDAPHVFFIQNLLVLRLLERVVHFKLVEKHEEMNAL